MHISKTKNMTFAHNGDYSGEVKFSLPDASDRKEFYETTCAVMAQGLLSAEDETHVVIVAWQMPAEKMTSVVLPIEDVRSFLAWRVQSERIQKLEAMTDEELDKLGRQDEYLRWTKENY